MNLTEGKTLLCDYLTNSPDPLLATVHRGEPGVEMLRTGTPITVQSLGMDDLYCQFVIRVYAKVDQNVFDVQDRQDATVDAIEAVLEQQVEFERSAWQFSYNERLGALVAESPIQIGRDLM